MESTKADEQAGSGSIDSKPIVCFLGPVSSYTHQATMEAFPPDQYDLMPVTTIKGMYVAGLRLHPVAQCHAPPAGEDPS
ncbi:hypothetical protein NUW58_g10700 [Xylaria curta]|uniref:Uncharacterized protein n=1 Tax=Xylaria curta TaxID=42375 RepID=A0ACC1MH18_9PEZI|nr:hypothetical protein NUW58_g10700 [Xylaria curta]